MAEVTAAVSNATGAEAEREFCIRILPDQSLYFEGSSAQLTDEGLIPANFKWPRDLSHEEWEANGFKYRLFRCRPEGHKGAMRTWSEMDSWRIFIDADPSRRSYLRQRQQKEQERAKASCAFGTGEFEARLQLYVAARCDREFQEFKQLVPVLARRKRGRKTIAAGPGGEVSAHGAD